MGENNNLDVLRLAGELLYGERWQAPIGVDLGISNRAVRYWLAQATPCPDDTGDRLLKTIVRRREALGQLEKQVRWRTYRGGVTS